MGAYSVHFDEAIWGSDARSFVPERWLKPDAMELERYLVTFSKGARMCIGINLAYAEITMTLAKLFLSFNVQMHPSCTAETIEGLDRFIKIYPKDGICVSLATRRAIVQQ
ncbi:Cytochrome p450 protein [Rutstroemia sp. NJR-2017a WRK4]|nr:Cytochrome p450 protein [Rutstroemia sp. NJR-2017a WRK4]